MMQKHLRKTFENKKSWKSKKYDFTEKMAQQRWNLEEN